MADQAKYAQVIMDIPILKIDRPFEYLIPSHLTSKIKIGSITLSTFGKSHQLGYVVDITSQPAVASHIEIEDVLEEKPVFSPEMVKLSRFVADYYLSTMGEVLRLALPPGRGRRLTHVISLNGKIEEMLKEIPDSLEPQRRILRSIAGYGGKASLSELQHYFKGRTLYALLRQLESKNLIVRKYQISKPQVEVKVELYARLKVSKDKAREAIPTLTRAKRQQRILEVLMEGEISIHKLLSYTGASHSSLKSLATRGLAEVFEETAFREPDFYYPEELPLSFRLTGEQRQAVEEIKESIDKGKSEVFLLQGVTGSGKTEVYLQIMEYVLKKGKTAIMLVPEIALTPQTVNRVRLRFGNNVAVLHSGLGTGERYDQWRRIKEGQYRVVVGARSALFAPLDNLGVIVIDEEQENTYKQDRNPRYHARQAAIKRAELNGACVILGSATPSIESKFLTEKGRYEQLYLRKRIEERPLPSVDIVDMREERKRGNRGIFSWDLQREMRKALKAQQKVILFLNRRGFSSFIICKDCGLVIKCLRCSVSLTYHSDEKLLKCHHCDHTEPAPTVCPRCGGHDIGYYGVGTQRVESEIKTLFPEIMVTRMDTDTTVRRDAHRKKLLEFKQQKTGVLLGTQMIAKGLDFPDVTLVGIISADTALHLPDFRAAERTFQLLMQVSGRAGRGPQPGRVVVQTYNPENYAIQAFLKGDYDLFYSQEVTLRDVLSYPPFSELINIMISSISAGRTEEEAVRIAEYLIKSRDMGDLKGLIDILGPAPAPLSRIKNRYRWHIVLKVGDLTLVKSFIKNNLERILPHPRSARDSNDVTVSIDVDPVSLL
ncbi:MAG: primosomal protein N' [Actinomycetota bacterium]